jgi:hypothetical protein
MWLHNAYVLVVLVGAQCMARGVPASEWIAAAVMGCALLCCSCCNEYIQRCRCNTGACVGAQAISMCMSGSACNACAAFAWMHSTTTGCQ